MTLSLCGMPLAILGPALLLLCFGVCAGAAGGEKPASGPMELHTMEDGTTLRMEPPLVVALSPPNERTWGVYQFPRLAAYPGGRLLLTFSVQEDRIHKTNKALPYYVSSDGGRSWEALKEDPPARAGQISAVFDGEFLGSIHADPFDLKERKVSAPPLVRTFFSYVHNSFHPVGKSPQELRDFFATLPMLRWTPETRTWRREETAYDIEGMLFWKRYKHPRAHLIPKTFFGHPLLPWGEELLYADYRRSFVLEDGGIPRGRTISIMVSKDNGHSFTKRGLLVPDPSGKDQVGEPMLARTSDGKLACVIRRADQNQKSMLIAFSEDRGRTWSPCIDLAEPLGEFGVFPNLVLLENGVLVLTYGRPGVHVSLGTDGTGRSWTPPVALLESSGKPKRTCGYTSTLPMGPDTVLVAYSQFDYRDEKGRQRKAILTRRLHIRPPSEE